MELMIVRVDLLSCLLDEDAIRSICTEYYHGICWVFRYFSGTTPSWSWIYRYHYAPYPADLATYLSYIENSNLKLSDAPQFALGEPFCPYVHLLCCLPPTSAYLLPPSYARLITDPSSPLHSYYSMEFCTDLDGDSRSFRKVVLLPFIEEERIVEAVRNNQCEASLTETERIRNEKESYYLFSYSDEQSEWISPLRHPFFPTVFDCHCNVDRFESFSEVVALISTSGPNEKKSIFPSLFPICSSLRHKRLVQERNNIDTTVIRRDLSNYPYIATSGAIRELGEQLFRKIVFYDYPFLKMAVVEGIRTIRFGCDLTTHVNVFALKNKKEFNDIMSIIQNQKVGNNIYRDYIDLSGETILLLLRPISAMIRKLENHNVIPQLDSQLFYYPYSLITMMSVNSPINGSLSLVDYSALEMRVGSEVIYWKRSSEYHGSHGIVTAINGTSVQVELQYTPRPEIHIHNEEWVSRSDYLQRKSIQYKLAASRLWENWSINPQFHISFGFIQQSKQLVMKGYARYDPSYFATYSAYPLSYYSSLGVKSVSIEGEYQLSKTAINFTEKFMQQFSHDITVRNERSRTVLVNPPVLIYFDFNV